MVCSYDMIWYSLLRLSPSLLTLCLELFLFLACFVSYRVTFESRSIPKHVSEYLEIEWNFWNFPWKPQSLRNCEYQRKPLNRMKIIITRSFLEQMTSNLFYLDHESIYFATIAHNWIISMILSLQFWLKVKKSKFRDTQIFRRTNFAGPWTGP